jgi:hypothetical protein
VRSRRPFRANLRRLFGQAFTVMDLADPLLLFAGDRPGDEVREALEREGVSVAGILLDGEAAGYLQREDLDVRPCRSVMHSFRGSEVVWEDAPLHSIVPMLAEGRAVFVSVLSAVSAVALPAHLQKPAARMFLFGAITLIEMYMTRRIRDLHPDGGWEGKVQPRRLSFARALREERSRRGMEVSLLDCLQLVDKARVLEGDEALHLLLDFDSGTKARKFFQGIEALRNELAHGHLFQPETLPVIALLARRFQALGDSIHPLGDSVPLDGILAGRTGNGRAGD